MPRSSAVVRRANKATPDDLAASIPPTRVLHGKTFSFAAKMLPGLEDDERDRIWHIFEENMYELYAASSFGWDPQKKRKEMFSPLSRFVLATDPGRGLVAYAIFRFEREERQDVVYCYELQVCKDARRFGLGRVLMQTLSDVGARWDMSKIMLTAFKANHTAMLFYKSTGFTIDEASPDASEAGDDEYDYFILSKPIP